MNFHIISFCQTVKIGNKQFIHKKKYNFSARQAVSRTDFLLVSFNTRRSLSFRVSVPSTDVMTECNRAKSNSYLASFHPLNSSICLFPATYSY